MATKGLCVRATSETERLIFATIDGTGKAVKPIHGILKHDIVLRNLITLSWIINGSGNIYQVKRNLIEILGSTWQFEYTWWELVVRRDFIWMIPRTTSYSWIGFFLETIQIWLFAKKTTTTLAFSILFSHSNQVSLTCSQRGRKRLSNFFWGTWWATC